MPMDGRARQGRRADTPGSVAAIRLYGPAMTFADRSLLFSFRPLTTNVGNDLIALGTDVLLRDAWGGPVDVVSLPSAGGGRGAKTAGLDARNVYEANLLADAVLIGGGNVFENGALLVDPTALGALQVPMMLLAASAGRVRGRDGGLHARTDSVAPEVMARLCGHARPLLVRDDATARLLEDLGVEHVTVAGCPSLLLGRLGADLPEPDESLAGVALLSLRHPRLMSVPYADQGRVPRQVERLIARLGAEHDRVALVCHDYQDLAFAAQLAEAGAGGAVEVRYTEDARELLGWLRGCAVSVGYRLHGFLACVALGVPALHLSYDERGTAMVETLDLGDYDLSLQAHDEDGLADAVGERLADARAIPPGVAAAATVQRCADAQADGVAALAARAADHRALRAEMVR